MTPDTPASRYLGLRCDRCHAEFDQPRLFEGCPACASDGWAANLVVSYDEAHGAADWERRSGRGLWKYRAFLPITNTRNEVTLGEGDTPLLQLASTGGWRDLRIKDESFNPTWSYKDRLNAVAVSKALDLEASTIGASSTGNHGASAAAYAARAGLRAVVFTREDVDESTVNFMQAYGASVVRTSPRGRWALLRQGVHELGWYPVSTYTPAPTGNPYGVEGYKTLAFELFEQMGVPDVVVVPTSYGEGLSGIWAGFAQLRRLGLTDRAPRMVAVEPAGGGPLATALENDLDRVPQVPDYRTMAASIAAKVASDRALLALRASEGTAVRVTDEQMLEAQLRLARQGLFVEPASAATLAALPQIPDRLPGVDPANASCVLIGTAGGLRQLDLLAGRLPEATVVAAPVDDSALRLPQNLL
jgi:threonine synthase